MRISLVGDANSIHIIRWAQWFRSKGHWVGIVSLTPDLGSSGNYDKFVYVPKKSGLFAYLRRALPIAKAVREMKPDIIHGHYLTGGGFYAVCSVSNPKNVIVSAWGSDIYKDCQESWAKRQCVKYAIKHSAITLGDSDHILVKARLLNRKARLERIIFGIDTEKFKPDPVKHDKFKFLSVRATTSIYNPEIIIKAFEQAGLDAELLMWEPMADSFALKDYVESQPELAKRVKWLSKRPYDEMPAIYNSCDVGISIPGWDSSSTAVNECMACGVPVIASDIPQNREWILDAHTWEEGNGFLSLISPLFLKWKMEEAMLSQTIKDGKGQRGFWARKTIVEKADWNTEMLKAEQIYKGVIDGTKH